MVDRYLSARRNGGAGDVRGSLARVEDAGLAGHASADEGPEGPPAHAGPGVGASE